MFRRLAFTIFFLFGGFLFYIPKWILFGTRGERQRKKIDRQNREILRRTEQTKTG